MTFKLGLTGSIGMGKSTTAKLFVEAGCDLWDADAAVHRLYGKNGAAVSEIAAIFSDAIVDGQVDRQILKTHIAKSTDALKKIEEVVHPLVRKDREDAIQNSGKDIIVLDIPLLFETGSEIAMDAVICVSVSAEEQEKRVLARPGMTKAQLELIRSKQMPNAEKCKLSDYVVETDTLAHAKTQVEAIVAEIRGKLTHA